MTSLTQAQQLAEYQEEFRAVKLSTLATCRDLMADLNAHGQALEAMAIDEAQMYIRAAFLSLDRTLTAVTHGKKLT